MRLLLTLLLMFVSLNSYAELIECQPEEVTKSNEIFCKLIDPDGVLVDHYIHLSQIDSVRVGQQPFYNQTIQLLNEITHSKTITVVTKQTGERRKRDFNYDNKSAYYRHVNGTVYIDGVDINLKLISLGLATTPPSNSPNNPEYDQAQISAQQKKQGIWSEPNPITPQQFDENWGKWQKQFPKVLEAPETIQCKVERVTNNKYVMCTYIDKYGSTTKADISYYQIWMPSINRAKHSFDQQAESLLEKLIASKEVTVIIHHIRSEQISSPSIVRDIKATVYVDGIDVNLALIKAGLAATYPSKDWPENPIYIEAQNKAQQQKIGLWANRQLADSWLYAEEQAKEQAKSYQANQQRIYRTAKIIYYVYPILMLGLIIWIFKKMHPTIGLFFITIPLLAITLPFYSMFVDTANRINNEAAGLLGYVGLMFAPIIIMASFIFGGICLAIEGYIIKKQETKTDNK